MGRRRLARKLLRKNPGLNSRDMKDLLQEYDFSWREATDLTAGRREREWRRRGAR